MLSAFTGGAATVEAMLVDGDMVVSRLTFRGTRSDTVQRSRQRYE